MSKKYEHRIEILKEHRQDKGHKYHQTTTNNIRNKKPNELKKLYKDFKKKIEKSKKIW